MKGIMFTEILYNKTVRKEKTQTRRAGKSLSVVNESPDDWRILHSTLFSNGCLNIGFTKSKLGQDLTWHNCESNYRVGEVLYIKEPVAEYEYQYFTGTKGETRSTPAYKYGIGEHQAVFYDQGRPIVTHNIGLKWKNKMFVGADKARAFIKITGIKCERLFDISDEDCFKEGVDKASFATIDGKFRTVYKSYREMKIIHSPQESYFSLFRFANNYPKKKEIQNQFVWVYDYVLCDVNGREI